MQYLCSKMDLGFRLNITMFEVIGIRKIEQLVLDNLQDATKKVRIDSTFQQQLFVICHTKNCLNFRIVLLTQ